VASILALLPLIPILAGASADDSPAETWEHFLNAASVVQLLVTALLTAPVIAEEIEDKTYAYLWSRPIPRWTVLVGKLIVGCLLSLGMMTVCLVVGSQLAHVTNIELILRGVLAIAAGVVATGFIASCLGTLAPKHPLAISICYFFILDIGIGAMPFAAARISVRHNVVALGGHGIHQDNLVTTIAWLIGISIFWGAITIRRLARSEMSTGS